ncbi:hypothetical protein SAMN05444141_109268 [Pseudovibrio denitrificans]|uniref:Inner membrane protein n=1 Tax=Pseudovibrio denitrificans TaxID=258256 RepID=A0A1I7DPC1_9HYPH|nr:phage tail protein [Pseudovibrio denitrificans]SFU13502.1 hypothetical protein SAMN05444141_109268 [Pseudovibrio denitrificans]
MAADDKKGGASTGAGSGGGTSSRKSPLSSGSRKPVTIDLPAKDVSKTDKPAASAGATAKAAASKATSSKPGAVPSTGKQQSQTAAKTEKTEATKAADAKPATGAKPAAGGKSSTSTAKPTAAASAKAAADEKKTASDEKKAADTASAAKTEAGKTTAASKATTASKTSTSAAAKEPAKAKDDKAGSGGKDTPPPPPPSGKGPGGPADKPPHPPKQGAGFGAMLAAGVIGALIVAGVGFGLHQAGMLQMVGAGSSQNATEVQAMLESSKNRYSQLKEEIAALRDHASGSYAAKDTIEKLTAQLDAIQKETSTKLNDATAGVTQRVQEQISTLGAEIKELNEFISNGAAGDGAAVASLKKTQDQLAKQVADLTAASQKNAEQVLKGVQGSLTDLQKQFQALKEAPTQLKDLSSQLAVTGSKVDEALAQIGKLTAEQKVLEGKIEALTQSTAETTKQMTARVDRLEKALGTASAQERAARAIAIASLRNAVDSGDSYEAELAAVEAVLPNDAAELAPLKASAATGIPSSAALIAGFGQVARDMSAVSLTSENDDVVDRLFSSAKSLVSVRTPNDSEGTSSSAVLGTMEARVTAGDLAGAIKAYDALPEPMQKVGAAWAEQVKARLAADELVKKITAQVLKSLVSENK